MASYRNRKSLRGMGAARACIVIALIAVTGVQAVVDNEMTDEQYNHSEEMAKTELTQPKFGMKVFVYYTDKHNTTPILVPAVITSVNNMGKGPTEINVRYLDGSTVNSRVYLEDVFLRDESVGYANWALDGFDPRTMHANGQPRITTGSSSRPFVSAPSMGAASGGASKVSSSSGPSMGAASGGASKAGGAGKKRKTADSKTGKQPMGHYMDAALYGGMDLKTAVEELRLDGVWMLNRTFELNKVKAELKKVKGDNDKLCDQRNAAFERMQQNNLRATAAEARMAAAEARMAAAEARMAAAEARMAAALQQQMETAEAGGGVCVPCPAYTHPHSQ